jgi:hypothetical protein
MKTIEVAITRLLEQEGCRRLPTLPQPPNELKKDSGSPWYSVPNLWIVGLFPGTNGWTIVKTSLNELFCRCAPGIDRSRLSELAMQIGCDAFHLSVYSSIHGMLMEVDAGGQAFISGWADYSGWEDLKFYGQPINKPEKPVQFFLLNVPKEMQTATRVTEDIKGLEKKIEELEVLPQQEESEEIDKQLYDIQSELDNFKGYFQIVDEELGQLIGGSYWQLSDSLVCLAFTQQQQLEANGVRLLYFEPPEHYRQSEGQESPYEAEIDDRLDPEDDIPF